MACIFYFFCSISLCNHQSLALADPYYSFCHDFIRLGDGYRLTGCYKLLLIIK